MTALQVRVMTRPSAVSRNGRRVGTEGCWKEKSHRWCSVCTTELLNPAPSCALNSLLCSPSSISSTTPLASLCAYPGNYREEASTPVQKSRNRHQVTDRMHKHNSLLRKQFIALLKHFSQKEAFKFSQSVTILSLSLSFLPLSRYLMLLSRQEKII